MSHEFERRRGIRGVVYALELLTASGPNGVTSAELEALLQANLGGGTKANKSILNRAVSAGKIFAKAGAVAAHPLHLRYFDTQAHCDACPLISARTPEQMIERRREYQRQRERNLKASGAKRERKPRSKSAIDSVGETVAFKPVQRVLVGEPIRTAQTKVTIIPTPIDTRYYVDPTHRGEFSAEWQAKRGEAVTC